MKKLLLLMVSFTLFSGLSHATNGCVKNSIGTLVCSPPLGSIQKNSIGTLVCGRGQCMKNSIGTIMCSDEDGGFIQKNSIGSLVCTGGRAFLQQHQGVKKCNNFF